MNVRLLIQGRSGLVSLLAHPLSTVSVIDVSSESACTCLCGVKTGDGVFCLFKKVYHVLQLGLGDIGFQISSTQKHAL